ncbi:MAG: prolipoprotein diacylglyceryl transferase [Candidatus Doudnabacteria bacterium]
MKKIYWMVGIVAAVVLIYFLFIPAFTGRLILNPILSAGPIQIRWYGLIMASSILAAYFLTRKNSWRFGISKTDIDDFAFWAVIAGIIGARVYYVIFNYSSYFSHNPSEIYKIWHGGLSIYGGILSGLVFGYFYSRKKAFSFYQLFDLIALSLPLAQAVGRFGNFVNQEAFGIPTNLPWKLYIAPKYRPVEYSSSNFFHPAFLYEALLDIAVFLILSRLAGKAKSGIIGWSYLLLYSLGRFFIEAIRLDSFFVSGFRVDQVVAAVLFLISGAIIFAKQSQVT